MVTIDNKFNLGTKVYFYNHSLELLKEIKGKKAFIVSDSVMETLGYLQKVIEYLKEAKISSVVFSGVRPNPNVKVIADGLKLYKDCDADVIVTIGGGSAIDTAKGILYVAYALESTERVKPLFITIPSTSGTGSEVTDFSVITAEGEKICIIDELITPDIAILDPDCIQHVPQHVIADTGIDVLVHAIEAYVSTKASDYTDALAEKAIKLVFENLENLYRNPKDIDARNKLQAASCIAGMAFTNASLGINHSLAHAFGESFHISHGRSNALMLNAVIEYNAELHGGANGYAAKRYAQLAVELNLPSRTYREGTVNFIGIINKLKNSLGVEDSIRDLGIEQIEFEKAMKNIAKTALLDRCTPTNPKQPTKEDLIQVLQKCY